MDRFTNTAVASIAIAEMTIHDKPLVKRQDWLGGPTRHLQRGRGVGRGYVIKLSGDGLAAV